MNTSQRYEEAIRLIKSNELEKARNVLVPISQEAKAADWIQKIDTQLAKRRSQQRPQESRAGISPLAYIGIAGIFALLTFAAGLLIGGYALDLDSEPSAEPAQVILVVTATPLAVSETPTQTTTPVPTKIPTQTITPAPTVAPNPTITSTASRTPAPARNTDAIFDAQVKQFLQEGALLEAMTSQGVNYVNFERQLVELKGAYGLADATWPAAFAPHARVQFDKAIQGWDLALYLWDLKLEKADEPAEPDINGYPVYVAYAGDELLIEVHPSDFIVWAYRGKKYLPFDENIGILFSLASDYFQTGQTQVLAEWQ